MDATQQLQSTSWSDAAYLAPEWILIAFIDRPGRARPVPAAARLDGLVDARRAADVARICRLAVDGARELGGTDGRRRTAGQRHHSHHGGQLPDRLFLEPAQDRLPRRRGAHRLDEPGHGEAIRDLGSGRILLFAAAGRLRRDDHGLLRRYDHAVSSGWSCSASRRTCSSASASMPCNRPKRRSNTW